MTAVTALVRAALLGALAHQCNVKGNWPGERMLSSGARFARSEGSAPAPLRLFACEDSIEKVRA